MSQNKTIKGYKVFNPDWTCRDVQYKVGESYEIDKEPIACERGYHFCEKLEDCFDYYKFDSENKVAEITAYGEIARDENKCCTNRIKIEKEISWHEVLDIVNIGKNCTGMRNSGNYNSGNCNSGNYNSGYYNVGNDNSGNCNSGNFNSGYFNSGNSNSGNCNSGNYNSGYYNSGNCNSGDGNSGDYNISDNNNGCFNTRATKMFLFNRLSNWTPEDWIKSKARSILRECFDVGPTEWVKECDIPEVEKEQHPEWETTRGYLKTLSQKEVFQKQQQNWNKLTQEQKEIVMSIPNFDKAIFKETTGIDVDK